MSISRDQFFRYNPDEHEDYFDGIRITSELLNDLDDALCAPTDEMSGRIAAVKTEHRAKQNAGLRRGSVSMSDDGKHSPSLQVVLPRDLYDQVQANAAESGMSASKYARRLIASALTA